MKQLTEIQIESISGGNYEDGYSIGHALGTIVFTLNSFGRGIGSGLYDALHN